MFGGLSGTSYDTKKYIPVWEMGKTKASLQHTNSTHNLGFELNALMFRNSAKCLYAGIHMQLSSV